MKKKIVAKIHEGGLGEICRGAEEFLKKIFCENPGGIPEGFQ